MPLDSAGFLDIRTESLHETADRLGIVSLPRSLLDEHKRAEIAKHPPHWLAPYARYYEPTVLVGTVLSSLVAIVCLAGLIDSVLQPAYWAMLMFGIGTCVSIVLMIGLDSLRSHYITIKGRAAWEERFYNYRVDRLPRPISELARQLTHELPGTALIVGKLIQNEIVLDPYLIARKGDQEVILGIWQDDEIIHIAETI